MRKVPGAGIPATHRETWIDARTSASSGTSAPKTVLTLDGIDLQEFDELLVYLDVNTGLIGTSPTMDIYLQRAIVPDPDAADDTHWDDFYAFVQVITSPLEYIIALPLRRVGTVGGISGASKPRTNASLSADQLQPNYWGDRIRIVEKMGGTVTTQAVYSIHATGLIRR